MLSQQTIAEFEKQAVEGKKPVLLWSSRYDDYIELGEYVAVKHDGDGTWHLFVRKSDHQSPGIKIGIFKLLAAAQLAGEHLTSRSLMNDDIQLNFKWNADSRPTLFMRSVAFIGAFMLTFGLCDAVLVYEPRWWHVVMMSVGSVMLLIRFVKFNIIFTK